MLLSRFSICVCQIELLSTRGIEAADEVWQDFNIHPTARLPLPPDREAASIASQVAAPESDTVKSGETFAVRLVTQSPVQ